MAPRKEPKVEVDIQTKRVTQVDYNKLALDELIREAVLKRCKIEDSADVQVFVTITGDGDEYPHGASVTIEEKLDS
jgi:hypothetical protein